MLIIIGKGTWPMGLMPLLNNISGNFNTATGADALISNTTGGDSTANFFLALGANTTGGGNTADGELMLVNNTTGASNTAEGFYALSLNTTGNSNIAVGAYAGSNLTTGNNNIDIGNVGAAGESGRIRIGTRGMQRATFVAWISGVPVSGFGVLVSPAGQLGIPARRRVTRRTSSRWKKRAKRSSHSSLLSFNTKRSWTPNPTRQFGLVAEQVDKVDPELVVRDEKGDVYSVRYEAVNAMLLNEFLKEDKMVEEQQTTIAQLKANVANQQATISEVEKDMGVLTAQLKEQARANPKSERAARDEKRRVPDRGKSRIAFLICSGGRPPTFKWTLQPAPRKLSGLQHE